MSVDWESLRRRSLQPGGFGAHRVHIWPQLLNVRLKRSSSSSTSTQPPHKDEHQISLDTSRSFILYPSTFPCSSSYKSREDLQEDLHTLIISLFRARTKLSYFQGYHDIISVFMLTLPRELQFACVEKLSLHWLRDSMGEGLEPVLGLLKVTKNLIRLADPELGVMLEQSAQLPFFALSNLLTLFSHDTPTLPLIQHVFDYILCRPPISVVYLAAAIIIARKEEVRKLVEEDEDGMIHSLLSSLPELTDEPDEPSSAPTPTPAPTSPLSPIRLTPTMPVSTSPSTPTTVGHDEHASDHPEHTPDTLPLLAPTPTPKDGDEPQEQEQLQVNGVPVHSSSSRSSSRSPSLLVSRLSMDDTETTIVVSEDLSTTPTSPEEVTNPPESDLTLVDSELADEEKVGGVAAGIGDGDARAGTPTTPTFMNTEGGSLPPTHPFVDSHLDGDPLPNSTKNTNEDTNNQNLTTPPTNPPSPFPSPLSHPHKLSLPILLQTASTLFQTYPPTHPSLYLSQIMGPQSVVHTWSEKFEEWVGDDDAERMVLRPDLVVYPFMGDTEGEGGESETDEESYDEARGLSGGEGEGKRRKRNKLVKSSTQRAKYNEKRHRKHQHHHHRLFNLPSFDFGIFSGSYISKHGERGRVKMEKRTMLAGVVVVIGIAMTMYGVKSGRTPPPAAGGMGGGGKHWPSWSW
ncbi:TBC1 domain family member 20 [Leucoagaricus sp. SymC.cos]|nr:TBC1 domain family member 20 [Leucoagaricus sp. SymC.cos]